MSHSSSITEVFNALEESTDPPTSPSAEGLNSRSGAFAKLRPANDIARNAFHNAILFINEEASSHHKQFAIVEGSSIDYDSSGEDAMTSNTEYDTDVSAKQFPTGRIQGCFTLSLDVQPGLMRTVGWRIGKGSSKLPDSRGVDVLIVRPTQKEAMKVAAVHASVQFNVESGALLLRAATNKPVWYYLENEEIKLQNKEQKVLSTPTNRFRIGELEYKLTFEVPDVVTFVRDRNEYLNTVHGREPPHPMLDPIPKPNHRRLGHVVIHNSFNSGAFGWILAGVDASTGQALAIKELRLRCRDNTVKLAQEEVVISRRFMTVRLTVHLVWSISHRLS